MKTRKAVRREREKRLDNERVGWTFRRTRASGSCVKDEARRSARAASERIHASPIITWKRELPLIMHGKERTINRRDTAQG